MATIAVVYHSTFGHTKTMAEKIAEGVKNIPGNDVLLLEIIGEDVINGRWKNEEIIERLKNADGMIFGSPTYMGSVSSVFKAFLEWGFYPWLNQEWKNKMAAGFTNSSSQNGDKLNTLIDLQAFASQMAMIWVPMGDFPGNNWSGGSVNDVNRLGSFMGFMSQSNADAEGDAANLLNLSNKGDILTAIRFGEHFAKITQQFTGEKTHNTERHSAGEWRAMDTERVLALK